MYGSETQGDLPKVIDLLDNRAGAWNKILQWTRNAWLSEIQKKFRGAFLFRNVCKLGEVGKTSCKQIKAVLVSKVQYIYDTEPEQMAALKSVFDSFMPNTIEFT